LLAAGVDPEPGVAVAAGGVVGVVGEGAGERGGEEAAAGGVAVAVGGASAGVALGDAIDAVAAARVGVGCVTGGVDVEPVEHATTTSRTSSGTARMPVSVGRRVTAG
jgi:hypothetical protein